MAKNKKNMKIKIMLISSILLILLLIHLIVLNQSFSLIQNEEVYVPIYGSIECSKTDKSVDELYWYIYGDDGEYKADIQDSKGNIVKTTENIEITCSKNYDNIYTNECEITAKISTDDYTSTFSSSEFLCSYEENNLNNCLEITPQALSNSWTYIDDISRNQKIIISDISKSLLGFNREIEKGELIYKSKRDEYGLITRNSGFVEKYNSCDLTDIYKNKVDTDILLDVFDDAVYNGKIKGSVLSFGQNINYIIGYNSVIDSSNLINNGKYYSIGGGFKYPIIIGKSNKKYVDMTQRIRDDNIICNPSEIFCINDGRNIDEQFGKNIECLETKPSFGYFPSTEKDNYVAQRVCTDGKWVEVNLKPIPECTSDKPILDSDYNCVSGTFQGDLDDNDNDTEKPSYHTFAVIIVFSILGGILGFL